MRFFAIDEPGSSVRALYATLSMTEVYAFRKYAKQYFRFRIILMMLKDNNRTGDQLQASVEQRFGRLCRNCGRNLSSDVKLNFLFLRKDIKLHLALLQQHSNFAHSYFLCLIIGPSSQGRGQIVFGGFFPAKESTPALAEKIA